MRHRRHAPLFKLQLCHDIRSGQTSRLQAQRQFALSASLIKFWLAQYDCGELDSEEAESTAFVDLQSRCAELERAVARLTEELEQIRGVGARPAKGLKDGASGS